ncbi:hypothetical protein D9758_011353 [Tetrapyrgos nigripes]|uniref:Uncharacterized protein n=1 Tax=Tetrapyrgos nigripes TaxID=182062 RepID=A0A8H5LK99_9AGAR|nr:hypothetical protein D9758_011353 [Tetrapyrgos nigripes]
MGTGMGEGVGECRMTTLTKLHVVFKASEETKIGKVDEVEKGNEGNEESEKICSLDDHPSTPPVGPIATQKQHLAAL